MTYCENLSSIAHDQERETEGSFPPLRRKLFDWVLGEAWNIRDAIMHFGLDELISEELEIQQGGGAGMRGKK